MSRSRPLETPCRGHRCSSTEGERSRRPCGRSRTLAEAGALRTSSARGVGDPPESTYHGGMLYGREDERKTLSALLEGSRDGVSGTMILFGGPGAGKSALLSDVQAAAT